MEQTLPQHMWSQGEERNNTTPRLKSHEPLSHVTYVPIPSHMSPHPKSHVLCYMIFHPVSHSPIPCHMSSACICLPNNHHPKSGLHLGGGGGIHPLLLESPLPLPEHVNTCVRCGNKISHTPQTFNHQLLTVSLK